MEVLSQCLKYGMILSDEKGHQQGIHNNKNHCLGVNCLF